MLFFFIFIYLTFSFFTLVVSALATLTQHPTKTKSSQRSWAKVAVAFTHGAWRRDAQLGTESLCHCCLCCNQSLKYCYIHDAGTYQHQWGRLKCSSEQPWPDSARQAGILHPDAGRGAHVQRECIFRWPGPQPVALALLPWDGDVLEERGMYLWEAFAPGEAWQCENT